MIQEFWKKAKKNPYLYGSLLVIILGMGIRFFLAALAMPSGDSCWHLNIGRYISQSGQIPLFESIGREVFARPPLFHIVTSLVYGLFGEAALNLVSAFFGSATLVVVFLIAKKLLSAKQAFYATFFMSFFPLHMYFSSISHLESTLTFFVVLCIYFALSNRLVWAAVAAGCAMLTKYHGPFVLPIILFLLWKRRKTIQEFCKKSILFVGVSLLVALPWYIRNFMELGNPVWPFMRSFFTNSFVSYTAAELASTAPQFAWLTNIGDIVGRFYFGLFAVPEGKIANFLALNIPFIELLVAGWVAATILFIFPALVGLFKSKKQKKSSFLYVWLLSFLSVLFIFALFVAGIYTRLLLPAIPVIAIFWAMGFERVKKHIPYLFIVMVLIAGGLVVGESAKTVYAGSVWQIYSDDFEWAKQHSHPADIFSAQGVCSAFYLNREVFLTDLVPQLHAQYNYESFKQNNVSYVFVSEEFIPSAEARTPKELLEQLENTDHFGLIYYNEKTLTKIYEVK